MMAMESIAEEEEEEPTRRCCLFCASSSPSSKNNEAEQAPPTPATITMDRGMERPTMANRNQSVYLSARHSSAMGQEELAALKEFEDAAMARFSVTGGGDQSVYFGALDALDAMDNDDNIQSLPYAPAQVADPRPRESISLEDPSSLLGVLKELKEPRVNVQCAGYPGNLTEEELAACQKFRAELQRRRTDGNGGETYSDIVRIYDPVETEPYSLCRFLRARQFNVDKVFEMVTEVLGVWREAQKHDYFPDPSAALGAPLNVFLTQLPSLYSGCAKNGSPVSYAFAANLSVEGIECLTELENIEKYAWFSSLHRFKAEIARAQTINPDVVRCEAIQIVDLKGLNASVLNKRTLDTLARLVTVNKCFPEILNSMVIVNAPSFFSFFWRIIRAMLDPRTASKIVMFSKEQDGINWMLERIDKSELLSDYGGDGDSFEEVLNKQTEGGCAKRQVVKRIAISQWTKDKVHFELDWNEGARFKAYTRSTSDAEFELFKDGTNTLLKAEVKGSPNQKPFSVDLFANVKGPGSFTIKASGKSSSTEYFVVAGDVLDAQ